MCSYKTLKNNNYGYVLQCNECKHIQVAFSTVVLSFTLTEFYEVIQTVNGLYEHYNLHPCRDQKIIHLPTANKAVTMVFTITEVRELLHLLIEGRNKLQYKQLFVFNEN